MLMLWCLLMTIRMQANSIFLQPHPQEKQRKQLAINLRCLCLSRMGLGSPTYSPMPKFVWVWRPLLLRSVPIPVCTLTNLCPSRSSKRRSHGSLSAAPLLWEAGAKLCPGAATLLAGGKDLAPWQGDSWEQAATPEQNHLLLLLP